MRASAKYCLALLGVLLLFLKLFRDLSAAASDSLQPNLANDAVTHAWPFFSYAKAAIQSGVVPLWNPYTSLGSPFFAEIGLGLFYPLSWITLLADVPSALLLIQFLTVAIGMAGMYGYTRYLALEPLARFLSVALFAFAVFIESFYPTMGYSFCLMPVILWMGHRMMVTPDLRNSSLVALSLALCFLGGFPNYFIYTVLILAVYCACLLGLSFPDIRLPGLAARAGMTLLVVALMLGLVAIQLLPSYELSSLSYRSLESGSAYDSGSIWETYSTGLLLRNFIDTGAGHLFGNSFLRVPSGIFYLGGTMLFLPFAFLPGRHRLVAIALGVSLVALCLFIASYQVPALAFLQKIPFASAIRVNGRAAGFVQFLVVMLAGVGLSVLLEQAKAGGMYRASGRAVIGWLLFAVYAAWLAYMAWSVNDNAWFLVSFAACAAWIVLAGMTRRYSPAVGWLLALVVIIDMSAHREFRFQVPAFSPSERELVEPVIELAREDAGYHRVVFMERNRSQAAEVANLGAKYQLPSLDAYIGLTSARWENYVRFMLGPEEFDRRVSQSILQRFYGYFSRGLLKSVLKEPRILELASLRYVITDGEILETGNPLPRAYAVGDYVATDTEEESLAVIRDRQLALDELVVLEGAEPGFPARSGERDSATVRVERYTPNEVVIKAELAAPSLVVLTDAYYPGWEASVDGKGVPIYRANSLFRAVEVPGGTHTVTFRYRSTSLRYGLGSTLACTLLVLGVLFRSRARH